MYATELHKISSNTVEYYSMLEIRDLLSLLCAAFKQPQYRVDKQRNILLDEKKDENDDSKAAT